LGRARFTEADWNTTSSPSYQPYPYSKTLAERKAWQMASQQSRWKLVTLNPGFILGPAINADATGFSHSFMRRIGDGTFKNGTIDLWFGFVDVRDVAQAHLNAGFIPSAEGRYIISGRSSSLVDIAAILRSKFGDRYPIPKRKAPKIFLWLFASAFGLVRCYVSQNIGVPIDFENRRSREELHVTYRPLESTVLEHFQQIFGTDAAAT
jgi:nucleoside-diphosphate-sugar epimerase